jgi:predicted enzyme related to lactoylglutathione lyase
VIGCILSENFFILFMRSLRIIKIRSINKHRIKTGNILSAVIIPDQRNLLDSGGVEMVIKTVGTVSVFVEDQERAKRFYMDKLGMSLRADNELAPGSPNRWVAVAPPGSDTEIILYVPDENWDHYKEVVGKTQALTISVTDMDGTVSWLKSRGVTFIREPETQPWGTFAIILDSEGNKLILVEERPEARRP